MILARSLIILTSFLVPAFFGACGGPPSGNSNANSAVASNTAGQPDGSARTNVEELGMLINVPYESEESFWKEDVADQRVIAVLRFPASEAGRLVADAERIQSPKPATVTPEGWFPPELIAQADMSGDDQLKGISYSANAFYQPPYNSGSIIRVENTDYFVLELSSSADRP